MAAPPTMKREVLRKMLADGMVLVHLDARHPGVRVPERLAGDPELRLNLSYRFQSHDLHVDDDAVRCTLSFGGKGFPCELPLQAIFAATSHVTGEAVLWPEDGPAGGPEAIGLAPIAEQPVPALAAAPKLESDAGPAPTQPRALRSRGHLRLIK